MKSNHLFVSDIASSYHSYSIMKMSHEATELLFVFTTTESYNRPKWLNALRIFIINFFFSLCACVDRFSRKRLVDVHICFFLYVVCLLDSFTVVFVYITFAFFEMKFHLAPNECATTTTKKKKSTFEHPPLFSLMMLHGIPTNCHRIFVSVSLQMCTCVHSSEKNGTAMKSETVCKSGGESDRARDQE